MHALRAKKLNRILISILIVIFILIIFRFYFLNFSYKKATTAYIYKNGEWRETEIFLDLDYNHNLFSSDNFMGSIYTEDVKILKYWKDFFVERGALRESGLNTKYLSYSPKNSYVDGQYKYSGFRNGEEFLLGKVYFKDFFKGIIITAYDWEITEKSGIYYVNTKENKPVVIVAGDVDIKDINKIKGDLILNYTDLSLLPQNLNTKISIPFFNSQIFKREEIYSYNKKSDLKWKSAPNPVDKEVALMEKKMYNSDEYIKIKISELERFKSGFISEININYSNILYVGEYISLKESVAEFKDFKLYSALLIKTDENDENYVENVYTIKINKDGSQKFLSDVVGFIN